MILQNKKIKALLGYCHNKSFGPYSLPVKFQNIICANYTKHKGLIYGPGLGEPIFSKNHIQLRSMIKDGNKFNGIVMLSFYMLPKIKKKRKEIFDLAIRNHKEIHFVIENLVFQNLKDIKKIEDIFSYQKFTQNSEMIFEKLKK